MATTVKAATSRVPRLCEGCHWTPSLRGVPTIAAGHRYLRHVAFPGDEINHSDRPHVLTECVTCACERDQSAGLLVAGACSVHCCDGIPCARPFKHDGNHSCRRCHAAALQPTIRDGAVSVSFSTEMPRLGGTDGN